MKCRLCCGVDYRMDWRAALKIADTKADTKRYDSDAFLDSVAIEIIGNSSRVGWSGRPFTPATGVPL